jgi:hypothetical protein
LVCGYSKVCGCGAPGALRRARKDEGRPILQEIRTRSYVGRPVVVDRIIRTVDRESSKSWVSHSEERYVDEHPTHQGEAKPEKKGNKNGSNPRRLSCCLPTFLSLA